MAHFPAIPQGTGAAAASLGSSMLASLFNAREAKKNRKWQEHMSNTAYQRAVVDMQKAGINPALVYGQGAPSASTPAGSAGTAAAPPLSMTELLQAKVAAAQARNIDADTALKESQTEGQTIENKFKPDILAQSIARGELDIEQTRNAIKMFDDQLANLRADTKLKGSQAASHDSQVRLNAAQVLLTLAQRSLVGMQEQSVQQDVIRQKFANEFQAEFGCLPDQPVWAAVTGLLGHASREGAGLAGQNLESLEKAGEALLNFYNDNKGKIPNAISQGRDAYKFFMQPWSF